MIKKERSRSPKQGQTQCTLKQVKLQTPLWDGMTIGDSRRFLSRVCTCRIRGVKRCQIDVLDRGMSEGRCQLEMCKIGEEMCQIREEEVCQIACHRPRRIPGQVL